MQWVPYSNKYHKKGDCGLQLTIQLPIFRYSPYYNSLQYILFLKSKVQSTVEFFQKKLQLLLEIRFPAKQYLFLVKALQVHNFIFIWAYFNYQIYQT